jgi:hypothetical protein
VKAALAVVALCLSATTAHAHHDEVIAADPSQPVQPADGAVLVARGSTWEVSTASGPRPTRQLAAVTLGGLDVAAGRREAGVAIHGDDALGAPPPAWPLGNRDDARRARAPIELTPEETERVALLWATRRFTLDAKTTDLRVLDVHARYGDGIVIWLNGVEIARRRIARDARPMEMASLIRGPEWETWHVPVVPGMLRPGDNVVAVEVRPSGRSTAPRLDVEIVGRRRRRWSAARSSRMSPATPRRSSSRPTCPPRSRSSGAAATRSATASSRPPGSRCATRSG